MQPAYYETLMSIFAAERVLGHWQDFHDLRSDFFKNAAEIYEKRNMRILLLDSVLVAEV